MQPPPSVIPAHAGSACSSAPSPGHRRRRQWDALLPDDHPFVSHAFLHGARGTGCIAPALRLAAPSRWALYDGDRLVAAAPLYLKGNSHGEFVFDWSWAQRVCASTACDYYPEAAVRGAVLARCRPAPAGR